MEFHSSCMPFILYSYFLPRRVPRRFLYVRFVRFVRFLRFPPDLEADADAEELGYI